eukprot:7782176-Alexandrium_andersonii.AAC.1
MSASLVGSEMCIRDRGDPRRVRLTPRRWSPRSDPDGELADWLREDLSPVSYTHLTLPTICSV